MIRIDPNAQYEIIAQNALLEEADVICLGEIHGKAADFKRNAALINQLYRPGDFLLIEQEAPPDRHEMLPLLAVPIDVMGWEKVSDKVLAAIEKLKHPCGDSPCLNATCGFSIRCCLDAEAVQAMIDTTPEKQQMICEKIPPQRRTFVIAGNDFFMNAREVQRRMDCCTNFLSFLCGIYYEPIDVAYNRLLAFLSTKRFIIMIPKEK